jgi:hypothetical protein
VNGTKQPEELERLFEADRVKAPGEKRRHQQAADTV